MKSLMILMVFLWAGRSLAEGHYSPISTPREGVECFDKIQLLNKVDFYLHEERFRQSQWDGFVKALTREQVSRVAEYLLKGPAPESVELNLDWSQCESQLVALKKIEKDFSQQATEVRRRARQFRALFNTDTYIKEAFGKLKEINQKAIKVSEEIKACLMGK